MIILDLNQVMISNYMTQIGNHTNIKPDEDLFRHMVLNTIRGYNKRFSADYGEMVIACDAPRSWRKDVYPYYKANRKKAREKSEIDWSALFDSLNKVREEIKEHFPYRVIQVERAEADDVIGALVANYYGQPILIISGDKDFVQLQNYMNVKQFDPIRKKYITHNNPSMFVKEHIMKGDLGDGVPNFLSADDTFVVGGRQKPLRSDKLDLWSNMAPEDFCDDNMLRNWKRNEQLVDLSFTPKEIVEKVVSEYEAQAGKKRDKLLNYFIQYRLKNLMEVIGDF